MSSKTADSVTPAPAGPPPRRPVSLSFRLSAWYVTTAFLLLTVATLFLYAALVRDVQRNNEQEISEKVNVLRTILHDRPMDLTTLRHEVEQEPLARQSDPYMLRVYDLAGKLLDQTPGMGQLLPPEVFPDPPLPHEPQRRDQRAVHQSAGDRRFVLVTARVRTRPDPSTAPAATSPAGTSDFHMGSGAALAGVDVARQHYGNLPDGPPMPVLMAWSGPAYRVQVAIDETADEAVLAKYRNRMLLVLALGLLVCTAGGYALARNGLRPLGRMADSMRRIRSSTLSERTALAGLPRELSSLGATFNDMLGRLEDAFDRLGRFSADIAHELRTPLNNLRGETEVALGKSRTADEYREVLHSSLEEYLRLSRLIDSLLFLARSENPETRIARDRLDVGRELEAVREFYEALADEVGVRLTCDAPAGLVLVADRLLFQRAVSNLVENALNHTPAGGSVALAAAAEQVPAGEIQVLDLAEGELLRVVRVEVCDTGTGIPPGVLPFVFDRFRRADESRSAGNGRANRGVGLGLAIVKGIARLHGGVARAASEPGKGTRVSLLFPQR